MFLKEIEAFRGNGKKNAKGQTLEEFLESYDPRRYESLSNTVDIAVFAYNEEPVKEIRSNSLEVLLVERKNHPSIGEWALPGGFVNRKENLEESAKRELKEETGISRAPLECFATYGNWDRDPRTRVITTAFLSLVNKKQVKVKAGDDAAKAFWMPVQMCVVAVEEDEEKIRKTFRVSLGGGQREFFVEEQCDKGLIQEKTYRCIKGKSLACDHGAILAQALCLLQGRAGAPIDDFL